MILRNLEKILHHSYFIVGLGIFAYAVLTFKPSETHNHYNTTFLPDTNKVKEIHHYDSKPNNQPITVIVQNHYDTSYRKKVEKEEIITGVKFKKGEVDVQEVDSNGKVSEEKHKVDPDSEITVTNKGVEEKRKTKFGKFLQKSAKVGKTALEIVGAIAILTRFVK